MFLLPFDSTRVIGGDRRFLNYEQATPATLALLGVPAEYSEYIRKIESTRFPDGAEYSLYHFLQVDGMLPMTAVEKEIVRAITDVRGVIVKTTTNTTNTTNNSTETIVCRSIPFVPEIPVSDISTIDIPGEGIRYVFAIEGTLLRLWYDSGVWMVSSHRRINGRNGMWGAIKFGDAFDEAFGTGPDAYNNLDPNYVYSFIVSHPKNKLIYEPKTSVTLVGLWHRPSQCHAPVPVDVPYKWRQQTFIANSTEELTEVVKSTPLDYNHAGVIVTDPTGRWPVKIVTSDYVEIRDARGSVPSLRARYIQLTHPDPDQAYNQKAVDLFLNNYRNDMHIFHGVDSSIEQLVHKLHAMYVDRYIHKNIQPLPKTEFVTIQNLHGWHCQDRATNIVTLDRVRNAVGSLPFYYLNLMLKSQSQSQF